jgi:hypothetical protein
MEGSVDGILGVIPSIVKVGIALDGIIIILLGDLNTYTV